MNVLLRYSIQYNEQYGHRSRTNIFYSLTTFKKIYVLSSLSIKKYINLPMWYVCICYLYVVLISQTLYKQLL